MQLKESAINMRSYYPSNDYRDFLEHSAKGSHWKNGHKYLAIINGRYIYARDELKRLLKKGQKPESTTTKPVHQSIEENLNYTGPDKLENRPRGRVVKYSNDKKGNIKAGKVKKRTLRKVQKVLKQGFFGKKLVNKKVKLINGPVGNRKARN